MENLCDVTIPENIDIFNTQVVKDIIDFKWSQYAKRVHMRGIIVHIVYIIALIYLVSAIYL